MLSQWMGCARFIWNAKWDENAYKFKQKFVPIIVFTPYDDGSAEHDAMTQADNLKYLSGMTEHELGKITIAVDRGVAIPAKASEQKNDFNESIKTLQKKLIRQAKGLNQSKETKRRIGKKHQRIANIRRDFAHQASPQIVSDKNTKIIIFEDLNTKQLTKKPTAKKDEQSGKYVKNGASAKAVLSGAILVQ